MRTGEISIKYVKLVKSKTDQVSALCDASLSSELPLKREMQQLTKIRMKEYEHFLKFRTKLKTLLDFLKDIPEVKKGMNNQYYIVIYSILYTFMYIYLII